MKKKFVIIIAVCSILMTGCESSSNKKTISIPYSDMFKTSAPFTGGTEEPTAQANESDLQSGSVSQTKAAAFNQDIANTPIDEICYIPYKSNNPKKDNISYHSYRVIFRTETDTYLLGASPYKSCKWTAINSICQELENRIDIDCQMIGVPSLNDLELLDESGIYIPGRFEMWTSTPVLTPDSTLVPKTDNRIYYRNSKGSYHATKAMSKKSGLCAIIKVSTTQNDASLLSASWEKYEDLKSRLEDEEKQYILDTSEEQS